MKGRRMFSERQILCILEEYKRGGLSSVQICKKYCISETRFYQWWFRYQHWSWAEILVLRALRRENARLRRAITAMQRPSLN